MSDLPQDRSTIRPGGKVWAGAVAVGVVVFFVSFLWFGRKPDPFLDKYRAITPAMRPKELEESLGEPTRGFAPGSTLGPLIYQWDGDKGRTIEVNQALCGPTTAKC